MAGDGSRWLVKRNGVVGLPSWGTRDLSKRWFKTMDDMTGY